MMRMLLILLFALLPGLARAAQGEDAVATLAAAMSLRCVFGTALETAWEAGSYQTRPQQSFSFIIDGINTARGNAKAVAGRGASHLEMIALTNVRHFLGFTARGDLNVTSVHGQFAAGQFAHDGGELLASHSVHMASEPPRTYQHFGFCKPASGGK